MIIKNLKREKIMIDGEEGIPIIENCYKLSKKYRHREICDKIILRCQQNNVKYVEVGQEVYVKKANMEKVVRLEKLSYYLFGESIHEIIKRHNISYAAYRTRINRGWSFERAITKRMQRRSKRKLGSVSR